jgi:outer membrane protein
MPMRVAAALTLFAAVAAPGAAQGRAALPIGFVSLQRVLAEAADAKVAGQSLEAARQAKAQELNGQKQVLDAARLELANSGGFFKATRRQELFREVQQREADLKKATEQATTDIQQLQQKLQNDLRAEVNRVLKSIAERKGLQFVFNQDGALIMGPSGQDLTEDVLTQLNADAEKRSAGGTAAPATPPSAPPASGK